MSCFQGQLNIYFMLDIKIDTLRTQLLLVDKIVILEYLINPFALLNMLYSNISRLPFSIHLCLPVFLNTPDILTLEPVSNAAFAIE